MPVPGPGFGTAPTRASAPAKPAAPAVKPVPLFVNPSFRFDPSVGLMVIEFHDSSDTVTNSIPSQRQLAAYRSHQATPPGEQQAMEPPKNLPQPANGKTSAG